MSGWREGFYKRLQKIIGFDAWHITTYEHRPYAAWLVWKLNCMLLDGRCEDGEIVEVGCGLGDIIANIHGKGQRIGYDVDSRVIWGAKIAHPKTKFQNGSFPDICEKKLAAVIAVDFLHYIPLEQVKEYFTQLTKQNDVSMIIVDHVEHPPYEYSHDYDAIFDALNYSHVYTSRGLVAWGGTRRRILFFRKMN